MCILTPLVCVRQVGVISSYSVSRLCFRALIHWQKTNLNQGQRRKEEARLVP